MIAAACHRLETRAAELAGTVVRRRWAITLGLAAFFLVAAPVDVWVAGWFYDPASGTFFQPGQHPLLDFVRKGLPPLLFGVVLYLEFMWLAGLALKERLIPGLDGRRAAYLLGSLAVGPGLVVNTLLKDNWGRARPSQIEAFGGDAPFTPAWWIADACDKNCSFVSGHGALGFWVTAFAFLAPPPWRGRALAAALVFGAAVGLVRMAQGGHFFSDVVFAGIITVWINWAFYSWLVARR
ncbi:phosphatase PAP2 family protein [Roseospirillum parvum]|uniref:Lipid A 4'-phosphatase n=1 Tax=Roseospirillum parvum TaxID=83401 RepID=A0A1G7ZSX6_9PROT|nr:phosphatase PAP2 family protein [Roseospirillum parvum]SDH11771.1 lipid A 4'-phosphatase [Roseospirillum parvum]